MSRTVSFPHWPPQVCTQSPAAGAPPVLVPIPPVPPVPPLPCVAPPVPEPLVPLAPASTCTSGPHPATAPAIATMAMNQAFARFDMITLPDPTLRSHARGRSRRRARALSDAQLKEAGELDEIGR